MVTKTDSTPSEERRFNALSAAIATEFSGMCLALPFLLLGIVIILRVKSTREAVLFEILKRETWLSRWISWSQNAN